MLGRFYAGKTPKVLGNWSHSWGLKRPKSLWNRTLLKAQPNTRDAPDIARTPKVLGVGAIPGVYNVLVIRNIFSAKRCGLNAGLEQGRAAP